MAVLQAFCRPFGLCADTLLFVCADKSGQAMQYFPFPCIYWDIKVEFFLLFCIFTQIVQSLKQASMKHLHTLIALMFLLVAGTSCEDDYLDISLFTGAEPIYQQGTCTNLISSLRLYLTSPEGIVVGIDGGDGAYAVVAANPSVVKVQLTEEANGYQRMLVVPERAGETEILVTDESRRSARLQIWVQDCYNLTFEVGKRNFLYEGPEISDDEWITIQQGIDAQLSVRPEARYVLCASDEDDPLWGGGVLQVYPDAEADEAVEGTYEMAETDYGHSGLLLCYNGEKHLLSPVSPIPPVDAKSSPIAPVLMWEEVTHLSPVALPEGGKVYQAEPWLRR